MRIQPLQPGIGVLLSCSAEKVQEWLHWKIASHLEGLIFTFSSTQKEILFSVKSSKLNYWVIYDHLLPPFEESLYNDVKKIQPDLKIRIIKSGEENHHADQELFSCIRESRIVQKEISYYYHHLSDSIPVSKHHDHFSTSEKEVLWMILQGFTTKEIANKRGVSIKAIEKHRNSLLQKTLCKNTAELVRYAMEEQIRFV